MGFGQESVFDTWGGHGNPSCGGGGSERVVVINKYRYSVLISLLRRLGLLMGNDGGI